MSSAEMRRAAREALWIAGELAYLLHSAQRAVRERFKRRRARRFVFNCSRRWGKSWLLCVLALECALHAPRQQIRYAAPTARDVRKIITPIMAELITHCPESLRPVYNSTDGVYTFPNWSQIHVAGVNNDNADSLRGTSTHLAIVDEAGFVDDLEYLVESVLMPQLLTTDGQMLISSTPAVTPGHPFRSYCEAAEREDAYACQTIHDAPHVSAAKIEEWCVAAGGETSSTWRREYLAMHVTDETRAVIPEWAAHESYVVTPCERPEYAYTWVSADQGFYDLTVIVAAHVDFRRGKLCITHERAPERATSRDIHDATIAMELEAFGGAKPRVEPVQRVVDAPAITLAELSKHGLEWEPVKKDDALAALNDLRLAVREHVLEIHPRCVTTISHLRYAVWTESRRTYERSADHGHFDGVDAAKYLVRHVDLHLDPWPEYGPEVRRATHYVPAPQRKSLSALVRR